MRKNLFLKLGVMFVASSLTIAPAFAGYDKSDNMLDQADHTVFGAPLYHTIDHDVWKTANHWGLSADENPQYGPGTIVVPYANATYGLVVCPDILVGEPGHPTEALKTSYNHCPEPFDTEQEADVIIQDLFAKVSEGTVSKNANSMGIEQTLDSLFVYWLPTPVNGSGFHNAYIDQTLDQDLAHMYDETLVEDASRYYGVWQHFHQATDFVLTGIHTDSYVQNPGDPGTRFVEQANEQWMAEESGSLVGTTGLTASGVIQGDVVVWLGTYFRLGENQTCGSVGLGVPCSFTETGGHGSVVTDTAYNKYVGHDP